MTTEKPRIESIDKGSVFNRHQELFELAEEKEIRPRIPPLKGEKILLLCSKQDLFEPLLLEKGADFVFSLTFKTTETAEKIIPFKAVRQQLPFQKDSIGFAYTSWISESPSQFPTLLKETNRTLKKGGKIILADWHPFCPFGRKTKTESDEEPLGFEKYFKLFREQGLLIGNIKEIFVDGRFRSFFKSETEKKFFQQYHLKPLALFFFLSKTTLRKEKDGDRSTITGIADHTA